jgi:hypothetical protein
VARHDSKATIRVSHRCATAPPPLWLHAALSWRQQHLRSYKVSHPQALSVHQSPDIVLRGCAVARTAQGQTYHSFTIVSRNRIPSETLSGGLVPTSPFSNPYLPISSTPLRVDCLQLQCNLLLSPEILYICFSTAFWEQCLEPRAT